MKTKASASKAAADEDEAEPKKIQSSRSKRHRVRRRRSLSSSGSESPPRKRSKKHSKRITDKKNKRSKGSSSSSRKRHHRSLSPSRSLSSSSSPSSIARHSCSTNSSSSSERSLSPAPRSRSGDVRKKKGRGRDRERDHKRTKPRRSPSSSSTSASSGSSRSRSRSKSKHRKQSTVGGTTRDKIEIDYDNRHASRSEKNIAADDDRDEEALATIAKKGGNDIDRYKKNLELESPPFKSVNETEMAPAGGGNSDAKDLELILRQKALENFRKFRAAAAVMEGKADVNGATGKGALLDGPQNAGKEIAEARPSAVNQFQRQGSSLVMKSSVGSPRSEDCRNGTSHSWKQEGSAGMSPGAASPRIPEVGDTGGPTQQKGRAVEATHSNCQFRSPQDGRNSRSVMQRLVSTPGSCASVNQRLGSSAGVSRVTGAPRIRSVVSIPAREGLDGSTYTTPPRSSEKSAPVESSSDIGRPLIDINKVERTNGDDRKTSEASASNGSILSPAEGKSQARAGDKDGDQFQKKTFSRMHDGETVEVSYKVYIPKKTPALARRKLQR